MSSGFDKPLLVATRLGVFLMPFLPLIVTSSMFFPFITGKGFAFRIIVEVIFACWILLALRVPAFRPKRSLLLYAVGAFLGIVLLADIFAENPFKAFWSNFERMEGFILLAHLGAYFLVASSVLREEKWWHRFFATSVGVSAMLGIYGLLQLGGKIVINQGGVRLDGTFGNAAYFAGYMLVHIFLALFLILRHKIPSGWKWTYGAAILLQIFTLVYTATRGAAIGLVGGLLLAMTLIALFDRQHKRLRMFAAGTIMLLLLLVGGMYAGRNLPFIQNHEALTRFASISLSAAGPRFMVWNMAWEGYQERPILGWGQEGFNYVFNKYYDPNMWTQEQWFDRTHNIFLDWLISAGVLGLVSYLLLFGGVLWYIWRGKPTDDSTDLSLAERSTLTGLLVGYMIHNLFVFDNFVSYLLFFSVISYVHARYSTPFKEHAQPVGEQVYVATAAVLLVALIFGIYFLNGRAIGVSHNLIEGLRPQEKGLLENLAFYERAAARQTIGAQEVGEQAMQAAISIATASNVPRDIKEKFVTFAVGVMNREIQRAPNDARLRMFIGGFYNRIGSFAAAVTELEKAHQLSPAKQLIAFELANAYMNSGAPEKALPLLKKAYELAPEFNSARVAYAASAVQAKDFKLAESLMASTTHPLVLSDERLIKAYFEAKQYTKVISLLKIKLELKPDDPQTHVSLAAAYIANGNRVEAIAALQKTIELDPTFKDQGEYYINEIRAGRNP